MIVGFTKDQEEDKEEDMKKTLEREAKGTGSLVQLVLEDHLVNNRCITDVKLTLASHLNLVVSAPCLIYSPQLANRLLHLHQ